MGILDFLRKNKKLFSINHITSEIGATQSALPAAMARTSQKEFSGDEEIKKLLDAMVVDYVETVGLPDGLREKYGIEVVEQVDENAW